jgi:hypothetical protein
MTVEPAASQISFVATPLLTSPDLFGQPSANGGDGPDRGGQPNAVQTECDLTRSGRRSSKREILDYAILLDLGGAGVDDIDRW